MKKIALSLLFVSALLLSACGGNKAQETADDSSIERDDSLRTALAEKDSLMAIVSEISDGMNQIKEMEKILNSTNLTGESRSKKQQIISDMALIQQSLADRRERLAALEARLNKSNNYTAEMKKTVENLKAQIATQEETIKGLTDQLAAANLKIENLTGSVDSLITENANVTNEKKAAQEESARLNNELNTCYYVIGSKSELKANKIIQSGFLKKTKVMESDYELSYFTKADKRTLTEIPLHSKKANVLSKHPSGSYQISDNGSTKTLVVTNPTKFWELSNFLIIQVD